MENYKLKGLKKEKLFTATETLKSLIHFVRTPKKKKTFKQQQQKLQYLEIS